jgi:LmbE family N-acetylglucosaminyl deacetylase
MRILSIHAHFDDFEFVASGIFELWRRKLGTDLRARVLVSTDGKAGHHFRRREETMSIRVAEQEASAKAGQYDFQLLRYPTGEVPREACLQVTVPLLAAMWKAIRDFEPDYIFAPPIPSDARAGIHVDHVGVSEAVRKVAYMINVPHAFTPEYPADETRSELCKVPVILTVHDAYMAGANAVDLVVDVEEAFEAMCQMTWCHQSQILEWIPWVGRHAMRVSKSYEDWHGVLRDRFRKRNREMGVDSDRVHEFFTVTAWGEVPAIEQILRDLPNVSQKYSNLSALEQRLKRWRGES